MTPINQKSTVADAVTIVAAVALVSTVLFSGGCECGDTAVISDESPAIQDGESEQAVETPSLPEREDPTAHKSDCSRQDLEVLDEEPSMMVTEAAHAAGLILQACRQELPAPLREALEIVQTSEERREQPSSIEKVEGFDAHFERSCPAGMEVVSDTESMDWDARLDAVYDRCGLEALEFLSREEFRGVRGPEHALIAAVSYRWMVADGVEVSLAERAARGVAGLDGEGPSVGTRSELLRDDPTVRLVSSTSELELESLPVVVVDSDGIWEEGRRVVDIEDATDRGQIQDYFRTFRDDRLDGQNAVLQLAMDAGAEFRTAAAVLLAAAEADLVRMRLVVGESDSIAESGSEIQVGEWEPALAGINTVVPAFIPDRLEDAVGDDAHQMRLAVEIRADGIAVFTPEGRVSARGDCDSPEVSICLADPEATHPVERYDWPELYRLAAEQHRHSPNNTAVLIRAEPEVSIDTLIRALDTLRYRRQTDAGEPLEEHPEIDEDVFANSTPLERDDVDVPVPVGMFADPALDVLQR